MYLDLKKEWIKLMFLIQRVFPVLSTEQHKNIFDFFVHICWLLDSKPKKCINRVYQPVQLVRLLLQAVLGNQIIVDEPYENLVLQHQLVPEAKRLISILKDKDFPATLEFYFALPWISNLGKKLSGGPLSEPTNASNQNHPDWIVRGIFSLLWYLTL